MKLIGRKKEKKELEDLYNSKKSEFVAITGRRRVGKTFLVNEVFRNRIDFYHVGISPEEANNKDRRKLDIQLDAFYAALLLQGVRGKKPKSWFEAFTLLIEFLKTKGNEERILIFIDELPWLDTPKSNFIKALEWFWNFYGGNQKNLMLVVCGSSTSWMFNNLIHSHGGLFERVTCSIHLSPFTLNETEQYFIEKGFNLSRYDISLIYMVLGGIPFYLNYYQNGDQIEEMVDKMFFRKDAKLKAEYNSLFESSFDSEKLARRIIEYLATRKKGYSRKEFLNGLNICDGEDVGKTIKALVNSDFILEYTPYGESKKNRYYKVIDPFCLFYIKQVKDNISLSNSLFSEKNDNHWIGTSFENMCYSQLENIKKALGINGIKTIQFSYYISSSDASNSGAQIDLIIERKDKAIHLCEMKFYNKEYSNDKESHFKLMNKVQKVKELAKTNVSVFSTLITTFGLSRSEYYSDYSKEINLDDLFG